MSTDRWEYKVMPAPMTFFGTYEDLKLQEALNAEGAKGWELVNVALTGVRLYFYFKRRK